MTVPQQVAEAVRRSLPRIPPAARDQIQGLASPANLEFMVATLVVWAGSHAIGLGEIIDGILAGVGAVFVGWQAFKAAGDLYEFAKRSIYPSSDSDLTEAGYALAEAVNIIGLVAILYLLGRGAKPVGQRFNPAAGKSIFYRPTITKLPMAVGVLGKTTKFGDIILSTKLSGQAELETLLHEQIHSALSPKFWLLRTARANMGQWAYNKVALLRYLEEALAETYALCRSRGVNAENVLTGLKFPFVEKYLTITRATVELAGATIVGYFTYKAVRYKVYSSDR
jgi:hypothetical protein